MLSSSSLLTTTASLTSRFIRPQVVALPLAATRLSVSTKAQHQHSVQRSLITTSAIMTSQNGNKPSSGNGNGKEGAAAKQSSQGHELKQPPNSKFCLRLDDARVGYGLAVLEHLDRLCTSLHLRVLLQRDGRVPFRRRTVVAKSDTFRR